MSPCKTLVPYNAAVPMHALLVYRLRGNTISAAFSIASGSNFPVSHRNGIVSLAQHLKSLADGSQGKLCSSERAVELMVCMLWKQPSHRCSK